MNLYLDCDGVILNTIERAFKLMEIAKLDTKDQYTIDSFFESVDWNILIDDKSILNNSITKIRELNKKYKIKILTTCVNIEEPKIKKSFFKNCLPNIEVITVPRNIQKNTVVNPINSILVDDSITNIRNWNNAGGIGILFNKNKIDDFDTIYDLMDIDKVILNKDRVLIK